MRFAGLFALIVGLLMFGQWAFSLASGGAADFQAAPLAIGFHLAADVLTALALVLSGLALLKKKTWGRTLFLVAGGMLLYATINSPGYFAPSGRWPVVAMFAVIFFLAVFLLMDAALRRD